MWQKNYMINFRLFLHKIEHFTNARAVIEEFDGFFYVEDEPGLYLLSVEKDNGRKNSLIRWYDLFPQRVVDKTLHKMGLTDDDVYSVKLILSRFGYFYGLDNRHRSNKDIFIFYYVSQLFFLRDSASEYATESVDYFFRSLCFELSISDDVYNRYFILNGKLFYKTELMGDVDLYGLIESFYNNLSVKKNKVAADNIKRIHLSTIEFFTVKNNALYDFVLNDYNKNLINPDLFLRMYKEKPKIIFNALRDCFDKYQSNENLIVSNFILMNYSYYILRHNPRVILKLKKYIKNDDIFSNILSAIIYRYQGVNKDDFIALGYAKYIKEVNEEGLWLYNLIYSV